MQLSKKEMVEGMNCNIESQANNECDACILGKMTKKPFPAQSKSRATRSYEFVHSYAQTRASTLESKGGSKYMVTFTYDFSRYNNLFYQIKK